MKQTKVPEDKSNERSRLQQPTPEKRLQPAQRQVDHTAQEEIKEEIVNSDNDDRDDDFSSSSSEEDFSKASVQLDPSTTDETQGPRVADDLIGIYSDSDEDEQN